MAILPQRDLAKAETLARIGYTNPFLSDRIDLEKEVLGRKFVDSSLIQYRPETSIDSMFSNADALRQLAEELLEKMRAKLTAGYRGSETELQIYQDLALFALYARYMSVVLSIPTPGYHPRPQKDILDAHADYARRFQHYFELPDQPLPTLDSDLVFAGLFQIERAFFHIFRYIIGSSLAAARLRAAIWESVFTRDMRRYSQGLYRVMGEIPTLITGPSGTGKELVARAIGYSQFVEFDSKKRQFVSDYSRSFHGLNLSAIPSELIESELFGHVKGAYTGATMTRAGFLDDSVCGRWDTVFLDEIGELDARIQVKLLRVLQEREFQRVGDTEVRRFSGKLVAATNRDLAVEMQSGAFREDFYYRLCADQITTPSLAEQLAECPEDLGNFVRFIARRQLPGLDDEVERLTRASVDWITEHLGSTYPWPGNIRELEQCVRSIMIRGTYSPPARIDHGPCADQTWIHRFLSDVQMGRLRTNELLNYYYRFVYEQSGSYLAAGKRLGVDWRTVKERVQASNVVPAATENGD